MFEEETRVWHEREEKMLCRLHSRPSNRTGVIVKSNLVKALVLTLLVVPFVCSAYSTADNQVWTQPSSQATFPAGAFAAASTQYFNATQLWDELWNATSKDNLGNYTKTLSDDYPQRRWHAENMTPSVALEGAWYWANESMKNNTGGNVVFHHVTQYESLLAIKNGTGPAPRQAILVTGVIDCDATPGANSAGSTVAAVLEIARIIDQYPLVCDVYYVLINRGTNDTVYDLGSRAFVSWLVAGKVETVTALSFERFLFENVNYLYGTRFSLRTYTGSSVYQQTRWTPDIMLMLSSTYGSGKAMLATDYSVAKRSMAYEMWQVGRSAVHVSQGYWSDPYHGTANDIWSNSRYSYEKGREIVACAASAVVYVASLGTGDIATFSGNASLGPQESTSALFMLTFIGFVNVTIQWDMNTTVNGSLRTEATQQLLYSRVENDRLIIMKYLSKSSGQIRLSVENIGTNSTTMAFSVTFLNDCDGDTLSDSFEISINTNPLSADSDRDGLSDSFELATGTDPTSPDSDHDGALDSDEYIWGSSPLLNDTDSDGLLDGTEVAFGTDPTKRDTDADGLEDWPEIYDYGTNPLSADTDSDSLEDGFEVSTGLNPLSPDSDGDGLSDLFEILNLLNPLSKDTDGDGMSDAYEVEFCLDPRNPDTDFDGIPDGIDWDPREHWLSTVAPATLLTVVLLLGVFSVLKYKVYERR